MLSYQAGSVLNLSNTRDFGVLFLANSSDFKVRSNGFGVHVSQLLARGRLSASLTTESGTADIARSDTTERYAFRQTNASLGWSTAVMLGETTLSPPSQAPYRLIPATDIPIAAPTPLQARPRPTWGSRSAHGHPGPSGLLR